MKDIKNLMLEHCVTLTALNTTYCQEWGENLFTNLEAFKNDAIASEVEDDTITYDAAEIMIRSYDLLGHSIPHPKTEGIKHIDIGISLKNITIRKVGTFIQDPITNLDGFDIEVRSQHNDPDYFVASWHLDKRLKSATYSLLEPEYHFTFGGKKMEELYARNWKFGQALIMRAPRIMHPPMDIILGIDFILNQFVPAEFSSTFLGDKKYQSTVAIMKEHLWKPYAIGLARNFYSSWTDMDNITFDNDFCKQILG